MACSGLHCAGCAGGIAVPIVPLAEVYGLVWIAEHIVEVIAVSAGCGVLAVAAVVALMRWADRRDAARDAAWRQLHARQVPEIGNPVTVLPPPARRELGAPAVHLHFHGLPDAEQAVIIRQALTERTEPRPHC
jgi:hypothetical protein